MANVQLVIGGPYGGPGGKHWDDGGTHTTVRKLIVQFRSEDFFQPRHHGYSPQKYLVVKSLTIQSNVKQYGLYGVEEGTPFITPVVTGKIVGFFGRNAGYLDSIGVYVKPILVVGIVVGPFGTTAGQQWDDGKYNTVKELNIHFGSLINSIQVVYDIEGKPILGEKHGSDGGTLNMDRSASGQCLMVLWGPIHWLEGTDLSGCGFVTSVVVFSVFRCRSRWFC
ncbi:jacalin-related lectin 3-like [Cornus florida]|uniref:jacalin-related lectin 3-like n=1 Tax=Cornus florida TaxID=4283 RepID=UPI00289CD7B9|nr:jacalin-related lectin 3-like [Cornus florida]